MFIASFASGPWEGNCYLIRQDDSVETVVIDPGVFAAETVHEILAERGWKLAGVLCTHGHVDHIADAAALANEAGAPMWLHSADGFMMTKPSAGIGSDIIPLMVELFGADELPTPDTLVDLEGVGAVEVAGIEFKVTHTPGHSPGLVIFTVSDDDGDVVFCGDFVFAGSIGRTDLPRGSATVMNDSLRRVALAWPDDARLLPGHGPATTAAREKAMNPYLQRRNLGV
ncbi:MAG: MBL fold metallo-hydrolase [Propionibacteriaceae bacterium]|nr:MBL fold metallo-hydrolase [Propionibacteriaceae bacterium]